MNRAIDFDYKKEYAHIKLIVDGHIYDQEKV
jgi:hypothetical protein